MSQPSPELVEAYNLIKAGQRQEAGRILKNYLAQNKSDPQAWWLMANAATQPETIRRCLETVLNLDPTNAKARARLEKILAEAGAPEDASPLPPVPRAASKPAALPPLLQTEPEPAMPPRAESKPAVPPRAASKPAALPPSPWADESEPATPPRAASKPAASARKPPVDDEFPPDELVLGGIVTAQAAAIPAPTRAPAPAPASPPAPTAPPSKAASFEDFLAAAPAWADDSFSASPPPKPVAASSEDLFAPTKVAPSEPYNPFDSARAFNPAAYANLGGSSTGEAQAPGTGTQPEWGPGLAFVPDAVEVVPLDEDEFDYQQVKPRIERMLRVALIVIGVFILCAVVLWYLDSAGWLSLRGDSVPDMTTLDAGSFTIEYPRNWDMRCAQDPSGYPVCGIANHKYYNEVDYFAFQDIDLGAMLADSLNLFSGQDLPEQRISVIVMDVPRTSLSYDNGSWAKTKYEWSQSGWVWDDNAKIDYDKKEMTIDGLTAYYYEYISRGSARDAAWDVYIEHDGIILWFRVDYFGPRSEKIPEKTIQAMIESIDIKAH
jgi:hypothetical protein